MYLTCEGREGGEGWRRKGRGERRKREEGGEREKREEEKRGGRREREQSVSYSMKLGRAGRGDFTVARRWRVGGRQAGTPRARDAPRGETVEK